MSKVSGDPRGGRVYTPVWRERSIYFGRCRSCGNPDGYLSTVLIRMILPDEHPATEHLCARCIKELALRHEILLSTWAPVDELPRLEARA